jgi:hypothetical protein
VTRAQAAALYDALSTAVSAVNAAKSEQRIVSLRAKPARELRVRIGHF